MARVKFLNTYIDSLTMGEAVHTIDRLIDRRNCAYVVTPNLDHIVTLEADQEFAEIYKNADLILADGKPLIWISRLLGCPIREKISGSDLFPRVCAMAAQRGHSIFILGAAEGVAAKAAENLKEKNPGLRVTGVYSPPVGFEQNPKELCKIAEIIKAAKPDILAVSLGSPKGEKFIYRHLKEYEVPLGISIGATIDFEAGNVKRAPGWISNMGFEWLFRITQDPQRLIKRYWNDAIKILPIIKKYKQAGGKTYENTN